MIKKWQSRGMIGQVSSKSSWKQASWGEKGRSEMAIKGGEEE